MDGLESERSRESIHVWAFQKSADWCPSEWSPLNIIRILLILIFFICNFFWYNFFLYFYLYLLVLLEFAFSKIYDWSILNFISLAELNTLPLSDPKTKNRSPEALVWLVDNVRCKIMRIFTNFYRCPNLTIWIKTEIRVSIYPQLSLKGVLLLN